MKLLICFLVIILGPPIGCFLIYKWLRSKGWTKAAYLLPVSLLGGYIFLWYSAFYPPNNFYEEEFVSILNIPWPDSAKVVEKEASYPDIHGDYTSCAAITLSRTDFDRLLLKTKADSSFALMNDKSLFIGSDAFDSVTHAFATPDYSYRFQGIKSAYARRWGAYVFVAFLTDHKTIIVYRASS